MADMAMVKRPARHAGEVGLFVDSPLFEDELATIRQGAEVSVTATQSRSLKQMRLAWGLCRKIADSGALGEADTRETMQYILLKAKHVRYVTNVHKDGTEITPIVKSIRFAQMDQTAFTRLFDRMLWIVATDILPDVPDGVLRAEIESMAGVGVPEPEPPKTRRRRAPAKPDHDPVTGEVHDEIPATEPVTTVTPEPSVSPAPKGPPPEGAGTVPDASPPSPSASASPPPPPAAQDKAGAAPIPKTVDDWQLWCKDWLDAADGDKEMTDVQVMDRWNREKTVRNACGVTAESRQKLFEYYTAILELKREEQAARAK